ncbi:MAG: hypothetical protein CL678_05495 [Bdellovibrionaceae bacterium]|nr:hypothetical protein [Pseudobdellovibrionaceae bacterium]|tara:strand:+ start:3155 stop:3541 length:387 start_codon:yes stop_codon:yes gene_type:complete
MNTFIIILNILLFSLILYNFIGKTNNIIENLVSDISEDKGSIDACPVEQRDIVFSCDQKMERLFRELNSIKQQMPEVDHLVRKWNRNIDINKRNAIIVSAMAQNKGQEEQRKLDKHASEKEDELNALA